MGQFVAHNRSLCIFSWHKFNRQTTRARSDTNKDIFCAYASLRLFAAKKDPLM